MISELTWDEPFYSALVNKVPSGEMPLGSVVATCRLRDCWQIVSKEIGTEDVSLKLKIPGVDLAAGATIGMQEYRFGDYAPGRYIWRLADVKPLPEPIPARGMQGLWNWEVPE